MKVKKLGIAKSLGSTAAELAEIFPGGETEMLDRIEITGFEEVTITVTVTDP